MKVQIGQITPIPNPNLMLRKITALEKGNMLHMPTPTAFWTAKEDLYSGLSKER